MSYDYMLQQAVALHDKGELDEAEKLYRQILEAVPDQPDVLNLLGLVAQEKGIHNEAVQLFYRAIKQKPDQAPYYFNLALSLRMLKKHLEALEYFDKVLSLQAGIKEVYIQKALIYQETGQIELARQNYQNAIDLDSSCNEAKIRLAATYNDDKALPLLSDLSENPLGAYYLSLIYMRKNDFDKALLYALKANNAAPHADEIKVVLGQIMATKQDDSSSETWFKKALVLNPRNQAALIGLANLYAKQNSEDAEALYLRLLDVEPGNLDAHINYAAFLHRQKRLAEALEEYRKAVIINPDLPETNYNLALVLKDADEKEEALALLFKTLEKLPEKLEISQAISETLLLLHRGGQKEYAEKIAANWVKSYPENHFARHVLAALTGEKIETDKIYTENLFELFADNYELVMSLLDYSVPMAMGRILGNAQGTIVDLGCGSGLAGKALKTPQNQIIGVDISQKMLEKAKEKNIYSDLICMYIADYLKTRPCADYFIAADVFNYLGDLSEIIALLKNKKICFSVETSAECPDYQLSSSGRYLHNPEYIQKLLQENGFSNIYEEDIALRKEDGLPVQGKIYFAQ